jgi:hypothetical protein
MVLEDITGKTLSAVDILLKVVLNTIKPLSQSSM